MISLLIASTASALASVSTTPHVVVIGSGWGGWGAASTLCEMNCKVTLLDALADPSSKCRSLLIIGEN